MPPTSGSDASTPWTGTPISGLRSTTAARSGVPGLGNYQQKLRDGNYRSTTAARLNVMVMAKGTGVLGPLRVYKVRTH